MVISIIIDLIAETFFQDDLLVITSFSQSSFSFCIGGNSDGWTCDFICS
jgi:hypothetical protein